MAGTAATLGALAVGSAATATTAATAGIVGFGGSLSALGLLSLGTTALGVASSISGTMMQRGESRQAAYDESLAAKQARLRGLQESTRIRRALIRDVSAATARSFAAGTGPTLLNQQVNAAESEAANEGDVVAFNTNMEVRRRRSQASIYRKAGKSSILDFVGPLAEGGTRLATQAADR